MKILEPSAPGRRNGSKKPKDWERLLQKCLMFFVRQVIHSHRATKSNLMPVEDSLAQEGSYDTVVDMELSSVLPREDEESTTDQDSLRESEQIKETRMNN